MDKNESSAILSDIERENADNQNEGAFSLRKKLGLPLNATTDDVFTKLKEQHSLTADATNKEVILAMLTDFSKDLNECNDQLNKLTLTRGQSLLGRVASLFAFKK